MVLFIYILVVLLEIVLNIPFGSATVLQFTFTNSRDFAWPILLCGIVWQGACWSGNEAGLPFEIHYPSSKWAIPRHRTGGPPLYVLLSACYCISTSQLDILLLL